VGEIAQHVHALVVEEFGLTAIREEGEGKAGRRIRPAIGGTNTAMAKGARMGDGANPILPSDVIFVEPPQARS